jgi:hypothetical protein
MACPILGLGFRARRLLSRDGDGSFRQRSTTAAAGQARAGGSYVTINPAGSRDRERSWFTRRFSARAQEGRRDDPG